jgi:hypothetical protein
MSHRECGRPTSDGSANDGTAKTVQLVTGIGMQRTQSYRRRRTCPVRGMPASYAPNDHRHPGTAEIPSLHGSSNINLISLSRQRLFLVAGIRNDTREQVKVCMCVHLTGPIALAVWNDKSVCVGLVLPVVIVKQQLSHTMAWRPSNLWCTKRRSSTSVQKGFRNERV